MFLIRIAVYAAFALLTLALALMIAVGTVTVDACLAWAGAAVVTQLCRKWGDWSWARRSRRLTARGLCDVCAGRGRPYDVQTNGWICRACDGTGRASHTGW